jgi:DNA-binding MltR family transcriptional regulator
MSEPELDNNARENTQAALLAVRKQMETLAADVPGPLGEQLREVMDFRISLTSETDRGCALMAAAFLDDRMKSMLAARLVDDQKVAQRVFEFNGPLGNFSSRIDFAYLLGVLPNNARRDLHLVRAIRNKFAHTASAIEFDHPSVKPLCDSLVFHGVRKETEPAAKFRRSVMGLLTLVLQATLQSEHIPPQAEYDVPDRNDAYQQVSEIWNKVTGGLPYPVAHHHEAGPDAA